MPDAELREACQAASLTATPAPLGRPARPDAGQQRRPTGWVRPVPDGRTRAAGFVPDPSARWPSRVPGVPAHQSATEVPNEHTPLR